MPCTLISCKGTLTIKAKETQLQVICVCRVNDHLSKIFNIDFSKKITSFEVPEKIRRVKRIWNQIRKPENPKNATRNLASKILSVNNVSHRKTILSKVEMEMISCGVPLMGLCSFKDFI